MRIDLLKGALAEFKHELEDAVRTGCFGGRQYPNGRIAKEALIRSQRLIVKVHEVVKVSVDEELRLLDQHFAIHPPLGACAPELRVTGFIKAKLQDVVVLFEDPTPEVIPDGPLTGVEDLVGQGVSERSLVIGVRSQMSSVGKNFDTLMERAFAETLNLRLRLPKLVMGEAYLLPIVEYNEQAMERNQIAWKKNPIAVPKFVRTFLAISGRGPHEADGLYKYERTALILADFREDPPRLVESLSELIRMGAIPYGFTHYYEPLSPRGFARDLTRVHLERHPLS